MTELKERDNQIINIDGKEYSRYEAGQVQRKIETAVRKNKDLLTVAKASGNKTLELTATNNIRTLQNKYIDFSSKAGLPTRAERMKINTKNTAIKSIPKTPKVANVSKDLFDFVPIKDYAKALQERFEQGTELAKKVYAKYIPKGVVENYNTSGAYFHTTKSIKLNALGDLNNTRGKSSTWFHEHGHYLDYNSKKTYSLSSIKEYKNALYYDISEYEKNIKKGNNFKNIYETRYYIGQELVKIGDVSNAIQDLLHGSTYGKHYNNVKWTHRPIYWKERKKQGIGIEREALAHMFEAEFSKEKTLLFQKYFPTAWEEFQKILKDLL